MPHFNFILATKEVFYRKILTSPRLYAIDRLIHEECPGTKTRGFFYCPLFTEGFLFSMKQNRQLTQKQVDFARYIFLGHTQREAWALAGYSTNYTLSNVDRNACLMAKSTKIQQRLAELRQQADDAAIATVIERKKVLSEIVRARVGQFTDENGNLAVKKDQLNNAAVQEVSTERTLVGVRTKIKLRDPIAAADLLNKMDKLYDERPVYQDNRVVNIYVIDAETKGLLSRVAERTGKFIEGKVESVGGDQ